MTMDRRKAGQISEAESIVMRVIWQKEAATTDDIIAALAHKEQWQGTTVKTLLSRLLKKGAVRARKDGRRYIYTAVLTHEQWLATESRGFLDRFFDGQVAPLVSYFSRQRKLSKKDVEDLKRVIEGLEDER